MKLARASMTLAAVASIAAATPALAQETGPSSSQSAFAVPTAPASGWETISLISVQDMVDATMGSAMCMTSRPPHSRDHQDVSLAEAMVDPSGEIARECHLWVQDNCSGGEVRRGGGGARQ